MQKCCVVLAIKKEHKVQLKGLGIIQDIPLVWAENMIGVIPVFKDEESAKKYAGDITILEFEILSEK